MSKKFYYVYFVDKLIDYDFAGNHPFGPQNLKGYEEKLFY